MDETKPIDDFRCHMCGNCCRGEGYVRITPAEALAIASFLGIGLAAFLSRYVRCPEIPEHVDAGDWWLIDKVQRDPECIFLADSRCRIDAVKPRHCRDFPMRWRTPNVLDYCKGMKSG